MLFSGSNLVFLDRDDLYICVYMINSITLYFVKNNGVDLGDDLINKKTKKNIYICNVFTAPVFQL